MIWSPSKAREVLRRISFERMKDGDVTAADKINRLAMTTLEKEAEVLPLVVALVGPIRAEQLRAEVLAP